MSAADVAKALGGLPTVDGGWLCRCPLPDHGRGRGDRRPSLSVRDGDASLLVYCFAGCDARDVLDHLRRTGCLEDRAPPAYRPRPPRAVPPQPPVEHHPDPAALALWRGAAAGGDVVGTYLRRRSIELDVPPTLRQGVALACGRTPIPTMVAAVQAPDRRVIAVQETFLTWEGAKTPLALQRKTTGALGLGAVRLAAAGEVLGIAEGVETALSAMVLSGLPCWACLGAKRLAKVELPPEVREIHIFADNDDAGSTAAREAAERYSRDGLAVRLRWPAEGFGDWNDALVASRSEAAA